MDLLVDTFFSFNYQERFMEKISVAFPSLWEIIWSPAFSLCSAPDPFNCPCSQTGLPWNFLETVFLRKENIVQFGCIFVLSMLGKLTLIWDIFFWVGRGLGWFRIKTTKALQCLAVWYFHVQWLLVNPISFWVWKVLCSSWLTCLWGIWSYYFPLSTFSALHYSDCRVMHYISRMGNEWHL